MSDFHQFGLISTLHRICDPAAVVSRVPGLLGRGAARLVLPCHADDLGRPAIGNIMDSLATVPHFDGVVLVINGGGTDAVPLAHSVLSRSMLPHTVVVADSPEVASWIGSLSGSLARGHGKGFNLWIGVGWCLGFAPDTQAVIFHDCDIESYDACLPLSLALPVVHPGLGYHFVKGFYRRTADRLFGRASRLFMLPFLQASVRVFGHLPALDFLESFRYPLSGEVAMTLDHAASLPFSNGWAVDVSMLCETFGKLEPHRVCQVDLGADFEHKHQPLGDGMGAGLAGMCAAMAVAVLDFLRCEGASLDHGTLRALVSSYRYCAEDALRRYRNVAIFNGLDHPDSEASAVEAFSKALDAACMDPQPPEFLPPWQTLLRDEADAALRLAALFPEIPSTMPRRA